MFLEPIVDDRDEKTELEHEMAREDWEGWNEDEYQNYKERTGWIKD